MSISSIAASGSAYASALQQQSATNAVQALGRKRENDGDQDDGSAAVQPPTPSVNLNGQVTGATINTTA